MPTLLAQIKQRFKDSKNGGAKTVEGDVQDTINVRPTIGVREEVEKYYRKIGCPDCQNYFNVNMYNKEPHKWSGTGLDYGETCLRCTGSGWIDNPEKNKRLKEQINNIINKLKDN